MLYHVLMVNSVREDLVALKRNKHLLMLVYSTNFLYKVDQFLILSSVLIIDRERNSVHCTIKDGYLQNVLLIISGSFNCLFPSFWLKKKIFETEDPKDPFLV